MGGIDDLTGSPEDTWRTGLWGKPEPTAGTPTQDEQELGSQVLALHLATQNGVVLGKPICFSEPHCLYSQNSYN